MLDAVIGMLSACLLPLSCKPPYCFPRSASKSQTECISWRQQKRGAVGKGICEEAAQPQARPVPPSFSDW